MEKYKKILFGLLGTIVLSLLIWSLSGVDFPNKELNTNIYYPDSEGWNRKALKDDKLNIFLPTTLKNNLYLVSPNEKGIFENGGPVTIENIFIEYRENIEIEIQKENFISLVKNARAVYALENFQDFPIFKIWVEKVLPSDFQKYKTFIIDQVSGYEAVDLEKNTYNGQEYYIYLRNDLSEEGLKGKTSIGGAYILFPKENTVVYLYFMNTRYNTKDAYLVSKEETKSIVEQIIDYSLD